MKLDQLGFVLVLLGIVTSCDRTEDTQTDSQSLPPPPPTTLPPSTEEGFYVSSSGSDLNSGTLSQPWKTLTKAANTVKAGQTVWVRTGTYYETLRPISSGSAGSKITFKAYTGDECKGDRGQTKNDCRVIIDGQNVREFGVDLSKPASFIRIEGFEIRNHKSHGIYFQSWYDRGVQNAEIVGNFIHHNKEDGVFARNSISSLIENNEIWANGTSAVTTGGQYSSTQLTVRGNNIHYNGKDGIQGGSTDSLYEYNVLYDQFHTDLHQDAFDLGNIRNLIIRYNTAFDFTQLIYVGLLDEDNKFADGAQIYGNLLYTNRYWTVAGGEAPGIFIDARRATTYANNIDIHSNTIASVGYGSIWVYKEDIGHGVGSLSNIKIRNNIFYQGDVEVQVPSYLDYNIFYGSGFNISAGSHNIMANPQFVNYVPYSSFNFHLQSTSPAIDKGMDLFLFNDIDGVFRPKGLHPDIGAYEF